MRSLTSRGPRMRIVVVAMALTMTLLSALLAEAALPPYYQRAREMQAILESRDVALRLQDHGPIDILQRVAEDLYRLKAGPCSLDVRIIDEPADHRPGWAGPRRFHLDVGEVVCG